MTTENVPLYTDPQGRLIAASGVEPKYPETYWMEGMVSVIILAVLYGLVVATRI